MIILGRVLIGTIAFFAARAVMPKSYAVDPKVPVQVTVSRNGELETVWTLPGKISVEGQTFKVWRNTLILCEPQENERRKCRLVE